MDKSTLKNMIDLRNIINYYRFKEYFKIMKKE
jgi:hypothetical protein